MLVYVGLKGQSPTAWIIPNSIFLNFYMLNMCSWRKHQKKIHPIYPIFKMFFPKGVTALFSQYVLDQVPFYKLWNNQGGTHTVKLNQIFRDWCDDYG